LHRTHRQRRPHERPCAGTMKWYSTMPHSPEACCTYSCKAGAPSAMLTLKGPGAREPPPKGHPRAETCMRALCTCKVLNTICTKSSLPRWCETTPWPCRHWELFGHLGCKLCNCRMGMPLPRIPTCGTMQSHCTRISGSQYHLYIDVLAARIRDNALAVQAPGALRLRWAQRLKLPYRQIRGRANTVERDTAIRHVCNAYCLQRLSKWMKKPPNRCINCSMAPGPA